jgi:hypothetical protein
MLLSVEQGSELGEVEDAEMAEPFAQEAYKDHTIYSTTLLDGQRKTPILSDFGETRFGGERYGEYAMPDL